MTAGCDILVMIKASAFDRFDQSAAAFKAFCHRRNVIVVSSPADGPGSIDGDVRDRFSEEIADYVLTASTAQYEYFCGVRDSSTVFVR